MKRSMFATVGFGVLAIGIIGVLIFQFTARPKIKYAKMRIDVQTLRSLRTVATNLKFQHQTKLIGGISKRILVPGILPPGSYDRLITPFLNDTLLNQDVLCNYEISLRHIDSLITVLPRVMYYIAIATPCVNNTAYVSYKLIAIDVDNNVIIPEVALRRRVDFLVVNPCPPADASGYPYRFP